MPGRNSAPDPPPHSPTPTPHAWFLTFPGPLNPALAPGVRSSKMDFCPALQSLHCQALRGLTNIRAPPSVPRARPIPCLPLPCPVTLFGARLLGARGLKKRKGFWPGTHTYKGSQVQTANTNPSYNFVNPSLASILFL